VLRLDEDCGGRLFALHDDHLSYVFETSSRNVIALSRSSSCFKAGSRAMSRDVVAYSD
jgi:hypothetical protein